MGIFDFVARALLKRRDKHFADKAEEALSHLEVQVKRLGYIRIADVELAGLCTVATTACAQYIQLARKKGTWIPQVHDALTTIIDMVNLYLAEADETALEKRFNLPDQNPIENARDRVLRLVDSSLSIIRKGLSDLGSGDSYARLAAQEEIE